MINAILYLITNTTINHIHCLNIAYFYNNTNILENIVSINCNIVVKFILLMNILNIVKKVIRQQCIIVL